MTNPVDPFESSLKQASVYAGSALDQLAKQYFLLRIEKETDGNFRQRIIDAINTKKALSKGKRNFNVGKDGKVEPIK